MLNLDEIPCWIIDSLKKRNISEDDIREMTARRAFSEYCRWNNLGDWGYNLFDAVEALQKAEKKA